MKHPTPQLDISSLINDGALVLNPEDGAPTEQRTVVVVGVARGGTTMPAQALHALGVHMGDKLSAVYEDVEICRPMEADDLDGFRKIVSERNLKHQRWGFKRPAAIQYMQRYVSELRNPNFIVMFRDIMAISNRNRISVGQDPVAGLEAAASQYVELVKFVAGIRNPVLLLSYEKSIRSPHQFVESIARFAGIDDPDRIQAALSTINPENPAYLEESRSRRSVGRIEGLSGRTLHGWAAMLGQEDPVEVDILLNNKPIARVEAGMIKTGLRGRPGLSESGAHGFEWDIPQSLALNLRDEIRVRVVGDIKDLVNSPFVLGPGRLRRLAEVS